MFSSQLIISNADAARIPLPSNSVHCAVTSPPYYALRAYAGDQGRDWPAVSYSPMPGLPALTVPAMRCNLGNESDPLAYIGHLVLTFREVYRVLREDGVAWVVMGDSYASEGGQRGYGSYDGAVGRGPTSGTRCPGAAGNLLLIPARLALALEADGWTVRNDCVWAKDAPMPESVSGWSWQKHRVKVASGQVCTQSSRADSGSSHKQRDAIGGVWQGGAQYIDCPGCPKCDPNGGYILRRGSWRHTRAHETVLMLSKGMGYFANGETVREASTGQTGTAANFRRDTKEILVPGQARVQHREERGDTHDNGYRNPRSVLRASPEPLKMAHYAAYPRSLIAPLVRATCPARACPVCGAGWAVVVERTDQVNPSAKGSRFDEGKTGHNGNGRAQEGERFLTNAAGLRPSCSCQYEGLPPDSFESIGSPIGTRTADDPSLETGRAGYNRPRGPEEGRVFSTRYEQREYAKQIKSSPYRDEMAREVTEEAFGHYIRTDKSGARPVPEQLLENWIARGWLERVILPEPKDPLAPIPGLLLDPFVGSGTSALVAHELGLRFVGLDISGEYLRDIALVRAAKITPQSALDNLPLFTLLQS